MYKDFLYESEGQLQYIWFLKDMNINLAMETYFWVTTRWLYSRSIVHSFSSVESMISLNVSKSNLRKCAVICI